MRPPLISNLVLIQIQLCASNDRLDKHCTDKTRYSIANHGLQSDDKLAVQARSATLAGCLSDRRHYDGSDVTEN
jgi:hypothetical protein